MEELLVTARSNDLIDPTLHIWTWEVAMYLFLGGVTAGIIIFAAIVPLLGKERVAPFASDRLAILAPIALSLGMTTLFLDLEHKLYVYRFYTTFRVLSPMSWGAWILIIIYPVSFLQILSTLRRGVPQAAVFVDRLAPASAPPSRRSAPTRGTARARRPRRRSRRPPPAARVRAPTGTATPSRR